MNNTHKILAGINLVIFIGGYQMISKLTAVLGLLHSQLTIAVLVLVILTPIIWGAILSWRFYKSKTNPELPKKGWAKLLAAFPFLNVVSILIFILVIVFYD